MSGTVSINHCGAGESSTELSFHGEMRSPRKSLTRDHLCLSSPSSPSALIAGRIAGIGLLDCCIEGIRAGATRTVAAGRPVLPLILAGLLAGFSGAAGAQDQGQPAKQINGVVNYPTSYVTAQVPKSVTNLPQVTVTAPAPPNGVMMPSTGNWNAYTGNAYITRSQTVSAVPADNKDPCDKNADPILPKTGTKIESYTDFSVPVEMGLRYERYYSSSATGYRQWTNSFSYWLDNSCQLTGGNPNTGLCKQFTVYTPDGLTMVFYGGLNDIATFTENGGNGVATLTHNADGTYTVHDEHTLTETYDANGTIQSLKDISGIGWTFSSGRVTHTNGQYITLASQSTGTLTSNLTVTDPDGNSYVYGYGAELNSVALPGAPATDITYKYLNNNDLLSEIDYNGVPYAYTSYTRLSTGDTAGWANGTYLADNSQSTSIAYGVDASGHPTATVTNPLGHVTTKVYGGPSGELSSVSNDAVADCGSTIKSMSYDANGNPSQTVDNNGNVHTYIYAANGQLLKETEAYGTPLARTTDYTWDTNPQLNRLSTVTVEGWSKTAYTYNAQNRLASVAVTNLSGSGVAGQTLTTNYAYTLYPNGMVHTRVVTQPSPNGSDSTTYTYDALGNLATVANGLGQTISYSNYNGLGEPRHVVGANGDATDFVYNARGRVASRTTHPNGVATTWTYAYDGFGLLSQLTAPDGEITTWSRDPEMRVTSITHNDKDGTALETFGYDANNDVTSDVVSRGGVTSSSLHVVYDALARPYKVQGNHGQVTTYSYDGNGNVLSMTNATGHVTSYQYDALDRVTQKTESGGASPAMPAAAPSLSVPSSSTNGNYSVSWTTVSGAADYELQEQLNGGSWAIVQRSAANGWSASGKTNGTYGYRVQACNASGCGPWSTTQAITVSIPAAPGAAPILTVPGSSATGAYALSWTTVSTASSYQLRQQFNGGGWSIVQSSAATSWSASGEGSGSYGYAVQACNAVGCGPWSATGTVVVTLPPPPATPSLSVPATSSTGNYAVSWGAVSGAASYSLRKQVNGGSWAVVQTSAATSWSASGQGSGSYGYEIQACNAGGCSAWSAPRTITVTIPVPIAINGQSYSVSYVIPMQTSASVSIGFQISGGNTWKVFTTKPGVGNGGVAVASGAVPATASTVQLTWVQQGPPSGDATSGGSVSNPASSPVALGTNPVSQYTSGTYSYRIDVVGMQYQLRVDFFNAAGANVSSSTCTLTATMAGSN